MALSPIGRLIEIKPRPQTTLQLLVAIEEPVSTVVDYVFTPSIKEHFGILLQNVQRGFGGGYWALSEYGGGKTHFVATLMSLLSATDKVAKHIADRDMQQNIQKIKNQRLFPVAFNLIGRGDMLNQRNALFRVLEDEMQSAARSLLGNEISLTLPEEVRAWWETVGTGIRSDIAEKYQELFGSSPFDDHSGYQELWTEQITAAAAALGVRIDVSSTPLDRLAAMYRQIVNEETGYTGLLIVIDEFASWQDQRPEGGAAYTEDENLLQTLAETLPRDHGLNVFTIVASQKPMPRKFEGDRFRQFDLLRASEQGTSQFIEYAMVVAARVRGITEYSAPEIEEYHDHYRARFNFARELSLNDFNAIFPMQPLNFDILRRITSNLTSARTGINVLWDVLGQEDSSRPKLRTGLLDTRRLITASDLLGSETLDQDLRQSVRYGSSYEAYEQAIEQIDRLAAQSRIFEEDIPVAKSIVRTLFLWHCSRDGQTKMTLDEITEAVLPDEGILDSPQDALLSILSSIEDVPQVDFDTDTRELSFIADIIAGRSGMDVFDEYRVKFRDLGTIQLNWQEHLISPTLSVGSFSAILGGIGAGTRTTRTTMYKGINYNGEVFATTDWSEHLGNRPPFDNHFRLVFMLRDNITITPDDLEDDRILVCVPGSLSAEHREAMIDLMALNTMQEDYGSRQDDEALRVNQFVNSRRAEITNTLLMAQRDFYRRGQILSRQGLSIDPDEVFGSGSDLLDRIVSHLFEVLFLERPIGSFRRNRSMNLNTETSRVFTGLWERTPKRSVRNSLENFAVGLGLTQPENPLRYNPMGCRTFDIIGSIYTASRDNGTHLQVDQIYEQLARIGVPARLATLYLLCYVRSNTDVELLLKNNHRIRLTDGGQLQGNRIHSNLVTRIEWNSRAFASADYFDVLVGRTGPVWGDCLEWARKFVPDLQTATDPEHVEHEMGRLLQSLEVEKARLETTINQVRTLESQLGNKVPPEVGKSSTLVLRLTESSSLEGFMATIGAFNLAVADDLGHAITDAHNLSLLGQAAIEITSAHAYLNNIPVNRLTGELARLEENRTTLIGDIDLTTLARHPSRWSGIKMRFDTWKRVYVREYRKLHRDFHVETAELRQRILETEDKLTALENIEQVEQITDTSRSLGFRSELEPAKAALLQCDPGIEAIDLEAMPNCTKCGIRVGDTLTDDLSLVDSKVSHALDELIAMLKSETISEALIGSESPILAELIGFLRTGDTPGIINILKDGVNTDLLRGVLNGHSDNLVIVKDVNIVRELSKEYPTVSQESIREVVDRFGELVEEALKTQQERVGLNIRVEMRLH